MLKSREDYFLKTDELLTQTNFHEYLPIKESCEKKLKMNENIRKPKPFWFERIRKMSKGRCKPDNMLVQFALTTFLSDQHVSMSIRNSTILTFES